MADLLAQAIATIKAGDKEGGRQILVQLLNAEPENDMGWLWMSAVVDTNELRKDCLEEALKHNPHNQAALQGLEKLKTMPPPEPEPQPEPEPPPPEPEPVPDLSGKPDLTFKFRFVRNRQAQGLRAKKGQTDPEELVLDSERLRYAYITDTTSRDKRVVLAISHAARMSDKLAKQVQEGNVLVLEVSKIKARDLERYIDRKCAELAARKNEQRLITAGRGEQFQTTTCPECGCTVDTSEMKQILYYHCRFCQTIFTPDGEIITNGTSYHVCGECGMFGRVKGYTEFYFYFLLVVYGFSYQRRFVCDSCAHKMFLKSFFLNLIFLLGVPFALAIKISSLFGRDPNLRRLAKANALAKKGKYEQASPLYEAMHEVYPEHPGLAMNEGLGHLYGKDTDGASEYFRRAVKACNNYVPALQLMHQQSWGQVEKDKTKQ